jgi:hypothetical protein
MVQTCPDHVIVYQRKNIYLKTGCEISKKKQTKLAGLLNGSTTFENQTQIMSEIINI